MHVLFQFFKYDVHRLEYILNLCINGEIIQGIFDTMASLGSNCTFLISLITEARYQVLLAIRRWQMNTSASLTLNVYKIPWKYGKYGTAEHHQQISVPFLCTRDSLLIAEMAPETIYLG